MPVPLKTNFQQTHTIIVFLLLISAFFLTTGTSLYLGWTSGKLKARVVEPIKDSIKQISQTLVVSSEHNVIPTPESGVNSVTNINIQTITNDTEESVKVQRQGNSQNYRVEYVYPTVKPKAQTNSPTFNFNNDYFNEVEERSRQAREESLRWFEEAKARNSAQFEADKARMDADQEAWFWDMQAKTEQWKKDHGF